MLGSFPLFTTFKMQMLFLQFSLGCGVHVKAGLEVRVRNKVGVRVTGGSVIMGME